MKLYASIIQRLEKELKIEVNDFPELGLCACQLDEDTNEDEEEEEEEEEDVQIDFDSLWLICQLEIIIWTELLGLKYILWVLAIIDYMLTYHEGNELISSPMGRFLKSLKN